jgi:hypothetical protein
MISALLIARPPVDSALALVRSGKGQPSTSRYNGGGHIDAAQGFRPGSAGVAERVPSILTAEKLTSIEVCSKNRLLDDSPQLNAGLYRCNHQGFQTFDAPDTASSAGGANVGNTVRRTVPAGNAGAELELLYRLTAHDRIGLNCNLRRIALVRQAGGIRTGLAGDGTRDDALHDHCHTGTCSICPEVRTCRRASTAAT